MGNANPTRDASRPAIFVNPENPELTELGALNPPPRACEVQAEAPEESFVLATSLQERTKDPRGAMKGILVCQCILVALTLVATVTQGKAVL